MGQHRMPEKGVESGNSKTIAVVEVPKSKAIVASADGKTMRRRLKYAQNPSSVLRRS